MPNWFGYRILTLFFFSSLCRLLVVALIAPKLKEVRTVDKIGSKDLFFSVVGIKPALDSVPERE
jgi:hypothetical protein